MTPQIVYYFIVLTWITLFPSHDRTTASSILTHLHILGSYSDVDFDFSIVPQSNSFRLEVINVPWPLFL